MAPGPDDGGLPQDLEDEVLRIVDGDEGARDDALRAVLRRNPRFATRIRRWLVAADVPVPPAEDGSVANGNGESLPMRVGAYVLEAVLGRGGFGTVYRAEQQEPIRRPVAVKILNPGMDSREILSRFAAEREALNRMDHPGIARLLDAGTTDRGRPFFVMELVLGPTLASHCRRENLSLQARLSRFLQVLDAMQHAHQKAVLHRDLSSNNVLVADPEGTQQPKIIDFGIAKSLADPLLQGGAMTFQGTLMGTPEFMSPEQAAGRVDDVDTRTDVYALGVQLYELLTDQLPIPGVVLRAQGLSEMASVIEQYSPVLPSVAAPKERRLLLRGDLDGIVMKAIAKSRDERYGTVGEFAADLRRHLADEPVQVAAPTTWYRLRKFVRRHRAQSAAVAIVTLGLLTAVAVMAYGLRVAHEALAEVQQQKDELAAKADAGFRLLANEDRLGAALAAERALPPPWPEHRRAYENWLAEHGDPLVAEIEKVEERLTALADRRTASSRRAPIDPADAHLESALVRLRASLRSFAGDNGPRARVANGLRFLREVAAPADAAHDAAWKAALAAITTSDGRTASTQYRGLRLPRIAAMVPLGCDPRTMLHEFLDLHSHPPGKPPPARDPETGRLTIEPDTGIVFVLIPASTLRLGTRRGDPGMAGNDEEAEDDELRGELVSLDEFLLARTELTNAQWHALAGGALLDDPQLPATGIPWTEATAVLAHFGMALPTEAQWECAARARTTSPWCSGDDPLGVSTCGWFGARPQRVGQLTPNAFGMFDTHGNVAEWCADEKLRYGEQPPRTGDGLRRRPDAEDSVPRVVRGGAHHEGPLAARSTARASRPPTVRDASIGVRPVRLLRPPN